MTEMLSDIRVLDITGTPSGAWCTRLLRGHGAQVHYLSPHPFERPGKSNPHDERWLSNTFLDGKTPVSASAIRRDISWIHNLDVLVTSSGTPMIGTWVAPIAKHTIVCAITPHGLTAGRSHYPGNDLTAYAWSGWASINGLISREPLKGPRYQASCQAGTVAFGAIMCALIGRREFGAAHAIDLAETEVLTTTFAPALLRSQLSGSPVQRRTRATLDNGPVPVDDGFFSISLFSEQAWQKAMNTLGLEHLGHEADLRSLGYRVQHPEDIPPEVYEALRQWSRADLMAALGKDRIPAGPVYNIAELAQCDHLISRGYTRTADGSAVRAHLPNPIHYHKSACDSDDAPRNKPFAPSNQLNRRMRSGEFTGTPLSGFRGISLTHAWAGPFATQLLGLMGADILHIEPVNRMDIWRGSRHGPMPLKLQGKSSKASSWNCNPLFNSVNLTKRSMMLDLGSPEGKELFLRLASNADFVVENFSPRVLTNLELDYEHLKQAKEDIVVCSISGYGSSGPWSDYPAVGGTIEPASGLSALNGYEAGIPQNSGQMYPDAIAGLYAFAAVATALFDRARTGEGCHIEISMQEAALSYLSDAWTEWTQTGQVPQPLGNHHPHYAPHNIYPAKAKNGRERWIAIAAENDDQWSAIVELARRPNWRERYPDAVTRKRQESILDEDMSGWTSGEDRDELVEKLCALGVLAAPVLDAFEVAADPVFRARGNTIQVTHPEAGTWAQAVRPFRFSNQSPLVVTPAPCLGQHSREILCEELGLSDAGYNDLAQRGITGDEKTVIEAES